MFLQGEIKNFIKNTLILTLFFTLILHLSWGYVALMFGIETNASKANSNNFDETTTPYLGNIATALSLNIGQRDKAMKGTPVGLADSAITISSVLANPTEGQKRLIGGNMSMLQAYQHLLDTDIVSLLDSSVDRSATLDEHINILETYGRDVTERIAGLDEQVSELGSIISESAGTTSEARAKLESSVAGLDYSLVDENIDAYTKAASADTKARIYKTYLEKFRAAYISLQSKNKKILDVLKNNREALIKRATVVVPDSGTDLLKELKLLQGESDYNLSK